jgi:hypothetical protein
MNAATSSEKSSIKSFLGLVPRQFAKRVRLLTREGSDAARPVRPWSLPLADLALLVATYWRTELTVRQLVPCSGKSAAGRIFDDFGPQTRLRSRHRYAPETILIVNGTPVPTRDRAIAAPSKNCQYSTNHQVVIDADTQLVVTPGVPLPGNRNDCPE